MAELWGHRLASGRILHTNGVLVAACAASKRPSKLHITDKWLVAQTKGVAT